MRKSFYILPFSVAIITLVIAACTPTRYTAEEDNFSRLYNKKASAIHPEFFLFHSSADSTDLYFKIETKELLYTRENMASPFKAKVLISYKIYDNLQDRNVIDSASTQVVDVVPEQKDSEIIGSIRMKMAPSSKYVMRIETIDINRRQNNVTIEYIDKSPQSRQNFMVLDPERKAPIFSPYLDRGQNVLIQLSSHSQQTVFGRYYDRNFPLAPPPFSMYNLKTFAYGADSLFEMQSDESGKVQMTIPVDGFFHFQTDTSSKTGLTLYGFSKGFPNISSHEAMLLPMRYITSKSEFADMEEGQNLKVAIEKFWINHAGSKERAREVIRQYYSRVESANIYFTSFVEGWKTDRGLIHIIYGNPNSIFKTDDTEVWVYGEETNINSISFTFVKVNNPFTDNDWSLSRNPNYKTNWYRALESWRQGRVYSSY